MGSLYAQKVLGVARPRVGLLSNGEESGKGNQLVKETYPLLEGSGLNFIGNIEGKDILKGTADVVVNILAPAFQGRLSDGDTQARAG